MAEKLSGEVLLEDTFSLSDKKYKVILSSEFLQYDELPSTKSEKSARRVQISDIIGCHAKLDIANSDSKKLHRTLSKSGINLSSVVFITVFSYPCQKPFCTIRNRSRVAITFGICSGSTREENERIAFVWKNVINCLARGFHVKPSDVGHCKAPSWGRFLVLINPHSGLGKAMKIFHTQVVPMLEEAEIPFEEVVTDHADHARELMQILELSEWQAVVIVSGDGLICEVMNGLMQRGDWQLAIRTAVGIVPAGSGNALACTISHAAGEQFKVNAELNSMFVLIKHVVKPMDLVMIQTPSQHLFSFLSLTWGLIADCDIDTEKYRCLGEARFTLGALRSIATLPTYAGKLSFLPVAGYKPKHGRGDWYKTSTSIPLCSLAAREAESADQDVDAEKPALGGTGSLEHGDVDGVAAPGTRNTVHMAQCPVNTLNDRDMPGAQHSLTGPPAHSVALTEPVTCETQDFTPLDTITPVENVSVATSAEKEKSERVELASETATRGEAKAGREGGRDSLSTELTRCSCVPPLQEPLGEGWQVVQGRFIMVCAVYQTHLGSDLFMAPASQLDDGVIYLQIVREGISRYRLFRLLLTLDKGTHIHSPDLDIVPVCAFRLEPEQGRGHVVIDGERIDPVTLQAHVVPGMARVMARH